MRRSALILIATSAVTAAALAASAHAGTYQVVACHDFHGGPGEPHTFDVNRSWTQIPATPPTGLEAFVSCPPQGSLQHNGIVVEDHIPGPPDTPGGSDLFWRFTAPQGTTITHLDLDRFLGKEGDQDWRPYGRADGAIFDTCDIAAGDDVCQNIGDASFAINNATTLDYGVRCDATSVCGDRVQPPRVWVSLYSVHVTLNDPSAPDHDRAGGAAVVCHLHPGPPRDVELGRQRQHRDLRGGLVRRRPATDPGHAAPATTASPCPARTWPQTRPTRST